MASGNEFVGNYRLFHLIRAGALYEIWAVRPMSDTTLYAIKWLPKGEKYTRQAIADLKHEYAVGHTLEHPCIIKTHEYGTASNGAYMLLEYFKTLNLKQQIIANAKVLHHRAKDILINCSKGLGYMHSKGWVHRDVKPDNFLVNEANEVRLIDFNLSRKKPGGLSKLLPSRGKIQGTYSYMPPEQIRGQPVGPTADIYSMGCVIFELFNGRPPFTANSTNELLGKHLKSKPPDLTVVDKNITPEFAAFVKQMMAKNPADRPQNMKDVEMELRGQRIHYQPPKASDLEKQAEQEDE